MKRSINTESNPFKNIDSLNKNMSIVSNRASSIKKKITNIQSLNKKINLNQNIKKNENISKFNEQDKFKPKEKFTRSVSKNITK